MLKNIVLFCVVLGGFSHYGYADNTHPIEEIVWLQSYTPPFHIDKDSHAPQGGICDNLTEQLIQTIDDVKHTRLIVPQERINKHLNEGDNVCFPCVIHKKTANDALQFSTPTTVYPPFSVLTTQKLAAEIQAQHGNPIKLIHLLSDEQYVYGQAAARKFTTKINKIIENTTVYRKASLSWSSENESQAVIARLSRGFIDYTIDYPFLGDYFVNHSRFKNIVSVPIEEDSRKFVLGAIGCAVRAPNNFATKALDKINKALDKQVLHSPAYINSQRFWLEQSFPQFSKYYQQQILNTTEPANVEITNTPN
ncbi:ABC transporter substrate-binding protein [Pseudoalteromonas sp. S3785]|uniref:ABC transporter substrate-binding protein n=1 Tax=Pseudoalteromonas sp. S3785 TaxID=579545 RepID=UPI00110C1B0A|nr:ABC transporter substrate-binding protein [Pseudoalteromonas sp. S3785]TMO77541.1 ABC transporter substrate-binding protein [Pseudoalteromonas sp. S3785]